MSGGGVKSRDSSPVQSVKQDSELDNVDKDQYYQKVGEKNVLFPLPYKLQTTDINLFIFKG